MRDPILTLLEVRSLPQRHHVADEIAQLALRQLPFPWPHRGAGLSIFNHLRKFRLRLLLACGARNIRSGRLEHPAGRPVALPLRAVASHTVLVVEALSFGGVTGGAG